MPYHILQDLHTDIFKFFFTQGRTHHSHIQVHKVEDTLTHALTRTLTHALTHALTHTLIYTLTHTLTHMEEHGEMVKHSHSLTRSHADTP